MIIGASCPCRFRLTRSTSSTLVHNLSKCQWQRFLNLRSSHSTSIGTKEGPTLKDDGWEFWGKKDNEAGKAIQVDGKNIFVGDLEATLKAHRAANRAKRIRYFPGDVMKQKVGFYRLNKSQSGQDDTSLAKSRQASRQDKDIKSKGSTPGKNALKLGKRKVGREKNVSNFAKEGSNPHKRKANKVQGDYKGKNVDPQNLWARNVIEPNRTLESPWLKYLKPGGGTALTRAALEVKAYEQYFNLTPSEEDAFNFVKDEVIAIAKEVIPGVSVNRLGSHIYGLGTPTSDIDLKIFHPDFEKPPFSRGPSPGRPESRKKNLDYLKTLQTALVESTLFYEPEIFDAKVPNFKVLHRYTNIIVNIQICLENTPETYYRKAYLAEFPTLRALYVLLRSALQIRGLNSTYEGGLGSYSIFMMIVYALKTGSPRIRSDDIAGQLLHTLEIYAALNLYEYGFSLEPPRSFRKLREEEKKSQGGSTQSGIENLRVINRRQPYCLCLQDPANPLNDLGKKSYQIKNIQEVFLHTRKDIRKAMWEYTSFEDSYPGDTYRDALLYPLVGANYEAFERGRSNLEEKVGDSKNLNEYMQIAQSKIKRKFSTD